MVRYVVCRYFPDLCSDHYENIGIIAQEGGRFGIRFVKEPAAVGLDVNELSDELLRLAGRAFRNAIKRADDDLEAQGILEWLGKTNDSNYQFTRVKYATPGLDLERAVDATFRREVGDINRVGKGKLRFYSSFVSRA